MEMKAYMDAFLYIRLAKSAHSAAQTFFALRLLLFEIPLREFCVDWKMQSEWRGVRQCNGDVVGRGLAPAVLQ